MSDLECPYCGAENKVCHDDGYGYEEDDLHEMECCKCEKLFVFTTSIIFYYRSYAAECLNTSKHDLVETKTYPKRFSRMQCKHCSYSEPLSKDRLDEILKEETGDE